MARLEDYSTSRIFTAQRPHLDSVLLSGGISAKMRYGFLWCIQHVLGTNDRRCCVRKTESGFSMFLIRKYFPAFAVGAGIFNIFVAPSLHYIRESFHPHLALFLAILVAAAFAFFLGLGVYRMRSSGNVGFSMALGMVFLPTFLLWWFPSFLPGSPGLRPHVAILGVITIALVFVAGYFSLRFFREDLRFRRIGYGVLFLCSALGFSFAFRSLALSASPLPSLIWGLYMLLSMIGWGGLVDRFHALERKSGWAERASWGMAALIVLGGILNFSYSISIGTIHLVLGAGIGLLGMDFAAMPRTRILRSRSGMAMVLFVLIGAAGLFQLAAAGGGTIDTVYERPAFDLHDDEQAYLVFPEKMLQLGSLGPEPFEARRMLSMGGQSFLQAIVLSGLPLRAIHLFDMGIAPLIILGLVFTFGKRRGFDQRLQVFSSVLVLAIPHLKMRGNTTALMGGIVLMLAWFLLLENSEDSPRPVLTALIAAALCALKSTFIPAAVGIFLLTLLVDLRRPAARKAHLQTAVLIAFFDLPWMLSILSSSGTLLYPLFGRGTYGGVFTGNFANVPGGEDANLTIVFRSIWRHLMDWIPSMLLLLFLEQKRRNRGALALAFAAFFSIICLISLGDPEIHRGISRYAFPVITASFLALMLVCLGEKEGRKSISLGLVAALVIGSSWMMFKRDVIQKNWDQIILNFSRASTEKDWIPEKDRTAIKTLEDSLPGKDALLASLRHPALLNFRERRIYIMSLPGMAMLPPGMPIFEGGEAVGSYLLDQNIPLLAYGALDDSVALLKLSEADIRNRYPDSKMRWALLKYHQRYHGVVRELAASRKPLYEDGRRIVLDLRKKVRTLVFADHPEVVRGLYRGFWSEKIFRIETLERRKGENFLILRTFGWRPAGVRVAPTLTGAAGKLDFLEARTQAFMYRIPEEYPLRFDLEIESDLFDPLEIDAAASTPMIGYAFESLEITADRSVLDLNTRHLVQRVEEEIDPAEMWNTEGFYRDFNWSAERAVIKDIEWPLSGDCCLLHISLFPADHWGRSGSGLRVWANSIELLPDHQSGLDYYFRLYRGLETINRISLTSRTFQPSASGGSGDSRILGVPIREISLE